MSTSTTSSPRPTTSSGKFFFTNQPSVDPLANGNALTLHERNGPDGTSGHSRSPTSTSSARGVVNEFRAGFFRNRNNNEAVA